jgi:hypothetical protein
MSDVVFVDTNILVYAHDRDAGSKREKAEEREAVTRRAEIKTVADPPSGFTGTSVREEGVLLPANMQPPQP